MNELEEHVAVMLGGAGDIGSAAALEMAQHGAHVVLLDINSDSIDQAVERIESRGGHVTGEVVDALDFDAAADVLNAISERLGRIDFLSYLVGWIALRPSLEVPIDEFRRTLDVNLSAQFVWAQAVARIMARQDRGGSIALISSILSFGGIPRRAAYTASRGGINQLVRTLAVEWAPLGIRVNAIAPGWVETQALQQLGLPLDKYRRRTPMQRLTTPDDVAGAFRFLASHSSRWITGIILTVDGGVTAYLGPGDPATA